DEGEQHEDADEQDYPEQGRCPEYPLPLAVLARGQCGVGAANETGGCLVIDVRKHARIIRPAMAVPSRIPSADPRLGRNLERPVFDWIGSVHTRLATASRMPRSCAACRTP